MKEALQKVIKAMTENDLVPHLAQVCVKDGWMSATNGRVYLSTPVQSDGNFVVSGKDLDRALNFAKDMSLARQGDFIVLKQGRTRIKLPVLPIDTFPIQEPPTEWYPFNAPFASVLKVIRPFISDNATQIWSLGAYAHEQGVCATNNVVLADVDFDQPSIRGLIPFWLIDYIEENPRECYYDENGIYLKWADGTWLRASKLTQQYPEQVINMANSLRLLGHDIWKIPDEWREAYVKTLKFDTNILVTPTAIIAHESAHVETEIESPVQGESVWDHRYLGAVLEHATHWEIGSYPKATLWRGTGIRGLVVGKVYASR